MFNLLKTSSVDRSGRKPSSARWWCRAWRVEPGDEIAPVLNEAFASRGPSLIDVAASAEGYGDQLMRLRG